jgi:hypothetical protein
VTRYKSALGLAVAASPFVLVACGFDPGDRWLVEQQEPICQEGTVRCGADLQRCESTPAGPSWVTLDGCQERGLVCAPTLLACTSCVPGQARCDGQTVLRCDGDGQTFEYEDECDTSLGEACRSEGCVQLCYAAADRRSNVGCEYWAVDLDNAHIDDTLNAAAQQFAVVVSNPQEDVSARVVIEQDDSNPGEENEPYSIASDDIPPFSLRVFKLGPREVDGSPRGKYDAGTHTALTRHAYRITSDFPVVAYQFNPLENVNVFSNDASLLKPTEAVRPTSNGVTDLYLALGWPQTIASTDDPDTNFDPNNPTDLRAFLTLVGTAKQTQIRLRSSTRVIGGGPVPTLLPGDEYEIELGPFDVLNLETDDFNADFTGTLVSANAPVIGFIGSEASDAPYFRTLGDRQCCADHLEEQLDHLRTAGRTFVMPVSPNRTRAVIQAGAKIGVAEQVEYFRVIATTDAGARITTSLPDRPNVDLAERGAVALLASTEPFTLESDEPVMVVSVSPSQHDAGVPSGYPGGDPSLLTLPPLEQFRSSYVFLTPDKYSFDFVRIIAPPDAVIVFDGRYLEDWDCRTDLAGIVPGPPAGEREEWLVHSCQLSFPVIDPALRAPDNLLAGDQNDGVHRVVADRPVGVLVDGFDSFVSYAYAAGTDLSFIVPE